MDISNRILWLCLSTFQIIRQEGLFQVRSSFNSSENATHSQPQFQGTPSVEPTASPTLVHTTLSPTQKVINTTQSSAEVVSSNSAEPTASPTHVPTTVPPTQEETNTTQTSDEVVSSNSDGPFKLGLGATIMVICVGVVILFCLAAVIAGRSRHPNYDINQPHDMTSMVNKDISLRLEQSSTSEEG